MEQFVLEGDVFTKLTNFICFNTIPDSWKQPFIFIGDTYALRQLKGGPCGLIASVQAHMLLLLRQCPDLDKEELLIEALLNILYLIRPCFVICTEIDFDNRMVKYFATNERALAKKFIISNRWYDNPEATLLYTYSIAILTGPVLLRHFALPETFITEDGQTNITFVILMITGQLLDSYHDGNAIMGGIVIKGSESPQQIGIVSISETLNFQNSGEYFKKPVEKIWVAYYGGHFTAIVKDNDQFYEFDSLAASSYFTLVTPKHVFYEKIACQ